MNIQRPLFDDDGIWTPPHLGSLPSWAEADRVCIDLETHDPQIKTLGPGDLRDGRVAGIAFTIEGTSHSYYLPIGHGGGGNLDADHVWQYMRDQAAVFKGDLVAANAQYDLGYLIAEGVEFNPRFVRDPQIAAPLLDELQNSYSLQAIADREGIQGKSEEAMNLAAKNWGIKNVKADLWKLPAHHVAEYAIQDTIVPLNLLRKMEPRIAEQNLQTVYDLECRVLPVLLKMRRRGVRIDEQALEAVQAYAHREEVIALQRIKDLTGVTIHQIWRADEVARALRFIGVESPRTPKTHKPKVTKELLESIDHPVADLILRARKMNKLRTTFVESIYDHMIDGRIHCGYNQLRRQREAGQGLAGAAYGRLSSNNPNLQQQPARDKEIGNMWRNIFIPEEGKLWACLDFSSQEPRMVSHYAGLDKCAGGDVIVAAYNEYPRLDFHQKMADLAGIDRKFAKTIFLGLCYGMGPGKMCVSLGLPTVEKVNPYSGRTYLGAGPEGQAIIDQFHAMVPFVRELTKKCEARAGSRGYIKTISGRRCRFPLDENGKYDWTYRALNRLIQGAAADQTKMAMVALDDAGYPIALQVHDEVDMSLDSREQAVEAARIMENAYELSVPTVVDVEVGTSWGNIE